MLDKRAIRGKVKIYMQAKLINDKDVIINESATWTEGELAFFKVMLRQGGEFKVGGKKFKIITELKFTE